MSKDFRDVLEDLLLKRLDLIPWSRTNVGLEVEEEHTWRLETLFAHLQVEQGKSYLCAYDTLGFMTYLLLQFTPEVTYHSTVPRYDFELQPRGTWIVDISNLPPKWHELTPRYDGIVVADYCIDVTPEKCEMLLYYLRMLLKPGGRVHLAARRPIPCVSKKNWYSADNLKSKGFRLVSRVNEPMGTRTRNDVAFVVDSLEVEP